MHAHMINMCMSIGRPRDVGRYCGDGEAMRRNAVSVAVFAGHPAASAR